MTSEELVALTERVGRDAADLNLDKAVFIAARPAMELKRAELAWVAENVDRLREHNARCAQLAAEQARQSARMVEASEAIARAQGLSSQLNELVAQGHLGEAVGHAS